MTKADPYKQACNYLDRDEK